MKNGDILMAARGNVDSLADAITYALEKLSDMTTEEFRHGGDRSIREHLAQALGYADFDAWLNRK